jgi:hypothetical protein
MLLVGYWHFSSRVNNDNDFRKYIGCTTASKPDKSHVYVVIFCLGLVLAVFGLLPLSYGYVTACKSFFTMNSGSLKWSIWTARYKADEQYLNYSLLVAAQDVAWISSLIRPLPLDISSLFPPRCPLSLPE